MTTPNKVSKLAAGVKAPKVVSFDSFEKEVVVIDDDGEDADGGGGCEISKEKISVQPPLQVVDESNASTSKGVSPKRRVS